MPGGVSSPVRAFRAVGGEPIFIKRGRGSHIYDEDDNEFIDYVCSWGPLILGHSHPQVVEALKRAVERGTSFGAPTELETTLARIIHSAMPSVEMIRFVSSGTEAVMSALRLARAFTGRNKIVKFAGGYHGHSDGLLVRAGSGVATQCEQSISTMKNEEGIPDVPGVPPGYALNTLVAPYNNPTAIEQLFENHAEEIAAIIVEPVAANMGVVPPQPGFLEHLRSLTQKSGALLIFDEVITGFRVSYGGAQELYGIIPDLTCLGKVIGGGLPVAAYGGREEIMSLVAPSGPVYQAGTLAGNPLAMTAGIETLQILSQDGIYTQLEEKSSLLEKGLASSCNNTLVARGGIPVSISRVGSIITVFFTSEPVIDYDTARCADIELYGRFFHHMLEQGIYLPPSQFEACFVSLAHGDEEIRATVAAFGRTLRALNES